MSGRILMVTDKYAPHAGGSAVVISNWCNHWRPECVRVITAVTPGDRQYDAAHPVRVHRLWYLNVPKVRMPFLWARMWLQAVASCRAWRPTVVHYGQMFGSALLAPSLSRWLKIPYILNVYGEELGISKESRWLHTHYQKLIDSAAGITACSHQTARLLVDEFGYAGPLLVVLPGVDTRRFEPGDRLEARRRLGLSGSPLLVTVARLMRRKGHDTVLQSVRELLPRYPDLRYVIVGDGPDRPRLDAMIRELGLQDHVTMLGKLPDSQLVLAYQAADVFVHPNRELQNGDTEGFGIVFLEAGSCQTPVIAGRSGGAVDAVRDGETGYLVDPQSHRELSQRLGYLLENPAHAEQLGRQGREFAKSLTWPRAAEQVWEFSMGLAGDCREVQS